MRDRAAHEAVAMIGVNTIVTLPAPEKIAVELQGITDVREQVLLVGERVVLAAEEMVICRRSNRNADGQFCEAGVGEKRCDVPAPHRPSGRRSRST